MPSAVGVTDDVNPSSVRGVVDHAIAASAAGLAVTTKIVSAMTDKPEDQKQNNATRRVIHYPYTKTTTKAAGKPNQINVNTTKNMQEAKPKGNPEVRTNKKMCCD